VHKTNEVFCFLINEFLAYLCDDNHCGVIEPLLVRHHLSALLEFDMFINSVVMLSTVASYSSLTSFMLLLKLTRGNVDDVTRDSNDIIHCK